MLEELKIEHGSEEWLQFRTKGIGGSDTGAILGVSPFKTNVEVWEEKTGRKVPTDLSTNEKVNYGKNAEDLLVKMFELDYPEYKVEIDKTTVFKRDFMFASLDGILTDKNGNKGVLEIKTTELFSSKDLAKWDKQIPQYYYTQLLHYLIVTGWSFAVLKAQIKTVGNNGETELITRHYYFSRESVIKDMKYLYLAEKEFWSYVILDKRPPLILPDITK